MICNCDLAVIVSRSHTVVIHLTVIINKGTASFDAVPLFITVGRMSFHSVYE